MRSSCLLAVVFVDQMTVAASERLVNELADQLLAGAMSSSSNSVVDELTYDYAGLATLGYDFDDEDASQKSWIRGILHDFEALNTDAADELSRRNNESSSMKLHGPRTFVITVGGPGTGKSYTMRQIFGGATSAGFTLGRREDYVMVNPDNSREDSAAFREILRVAKNEGQKLPRNLLADSELELRMQGRMQKTSWKQLTIDYVRNTVFSQVFNKHGKTSVVYDSTCGTFESCKQLLQKAKEAGYQRLAVVSVTVDIDCALYRSGELRARETGRAVPADFCRNKHKSAEKNAPLLVEEAKKLMPNSWVTVTANPKQGSMLDKHRCPAEIEYATATA